MKLFLKSALLLFSCLTIASCGRSEQESSISSSVEEKTLYYLELEKNPDKTAYYDKDVFDPSGIKVNAVYTDESKKDVSSQIVWNSDPLQLYQESIRGAYTEGRIHKYVEVAISVSLSPGIHEIEEPKEGVDCKLIAHRGYHLVEHENTYEAFEAAGRRSVYGIETDVYWTKDNHWICNHDNNAPTTSKPIEEFTLAELLEIELYNLNGATRHMCTFEDYLSICKMYHKVAFIELKTTPDIDKLEELMEYVHSYEMMDQCVFISFGLNNGLNIKTLNNKHQDSNWNVPFQLLSSSKSTSEVKTAMKEGFDISLSYLTIDEDFIDQATNYEVNVAAWTVESFKEATSLVDMGVKYITSDNLECKLKYLKETTYEVL